MAEIEDFDFEPEQELPSLPRDGNFLGDLVSEEGMHQVRIWFLFEIETYKPVHGLIPTELIRQLRDILPVFRSASETWIKLNPSVAKWRAAIPWLEEPENPLFADLRAQVEGWAQRFHLSNEGRPAEWILAHADANLTLWTMLPYPESELRWASLP